MVGFSSPFGDGNDSGDTFDPADRFDPVHIPPPGEFLDGASVLTGTEHVDFHQVTEELFERRGVYDVTFGYNLARLNLDRRHPDAGFRYAEETAAVLRAEFTPTTPFCPQSETLTKAAFRVWNDLSDEHEYDLVRVRVAAMHNRSGAINGTLAGLESGEDSGTSGSDQQHRSGGSGGLS